VSDYASDKEYRRDLKDRIAERERDYDFRCDECGAPHIIDVSIPSEIWNQIAPDGGALCPLCIDDRLVKAGLTAKAEFYYDGKALHSKMYAESQGNLEFAERKIEALETELAEARPKAEALDKLKRLVSGGRSVSIGSVVHEYFHEANYFYCHGTKGSTLLVAVQAVKE
jgi:hypothetical protein